MVERKNKTDQLVRGAEKTLSELGGKVDPATRSQDESVLADFKSFMETGGRAVLESKTFTELSRKLAGALCSRAGASSGPGAA
jgi:molecular chaperone DnaK (HSP70)